jgi:hypothetical protein
LSQFAANKAGCVFIKERVGKYQGCNAEEHNFG